MSHFTVLVLVPKGKDIEAEVARLLEPFDETLEVKEYSETCSCPDWEDNPNPGKASPECEDCQGTGSYPSTYNPESKWDWYSIGGRWNGRLTNYSQDYGNTLEGNIVEVQNISPEFTPFAIVTPIGEWHEKGQIGWWAMIANEKAPEDWEAESKALLGKYQDCLAVLVDAHI